MDDDANINYYDDIDEPPRDARNSMHFKIPRKNLMPFMEQTENQRTKRDNGHEIKQASNLRKFRDSFLKVSQILDLSGRPPWTLSIYGNLRTPFHATKSKIIMRRAMTRRSTYA